MGAINGKTFKSGNSEAIRLPKGVGFGVGTEMRIEREGDRIVLTPVHDEAEAQRNWLQMLNELESMPAPPTVQEREPIEFPDRPSL